MNMITIPKEVTHGEELIVIPRKLYEQFIRVVKKKSFGSVKLNKGLREALEDVKQGRIFGPFSSLAEGLKVLKSAK